MNYLAHVYLAAPDPSAMVGNLLGDFVRGIDIDRLPAALAAGIRQHRAVDAFTDAHPTFRRSRARLAPRFRRFSGVLVDVFYDHFLARDWRRHHAGASLVEFTRGFYGHLSGHSPLLPPRSRDLLLRLAAEDWLGGYRHVDGIARVLRGMSRRVARDNPLAEATGELLARYDELRADFEEFLPEVLALARAHSPPWTGTRPEPPQG